MTVLIIVLVVIAIIILFAISQYNQFIRSSNTCEEGFATMDVYLKKRYDLIPNIVSTVQGYAKHETDTLESVVNLRDTAVHANSDEEIMKANADLSKGIARLFALAEAYPDLKANTNFLALQDQLANIEKEIANARKYYNGCVKAFNDSIMVFPNNIFAKLFGFNKKTMFEIIDETERENVKVEF